MNTKRSIQGLIILGVSALLMSPAAQARNRGQGNGGQCGGGGKNQGQCAQKSRQPGGGCGGNQALRQGNRGQGRGAQAGRRQTAATLTAEEAAGLVLMAHDEQLARDAYASFAAQWNLRIFEHIGAAEDRHLAAVSHLLSNYGIEPPTNGTPGAFPDAALQTLYDRLVAQGSKSLVDALRAGALIEEIDSADLETQIASATHADMKQVYENLLAGSHRHLRAFVGQLERRGETYTPQHLDAAAFHAIVATGTGGGGGPMNRTGGPNRGGRIQV